MNALHRALALHQQGLLDEACEAYRFLLKQNSKDINALNLLGILHLQRGEWQDGVKHLKKCVLIKPDFAQAHYNLGKGLLEGGQIRDAIASLKRASSLDPSYADAWLTLAEAHGKNKDYSGALGCAQRTLALDPRILPARVNLIVSLIALKRYEEALGEAEMGLKLAAEYPPLLLCKGRCLAALERPREAVESFQQAIHAYQEDSDVLLEFGRLAVSAGRSEVVVDSLRRVLELSAERLDVYCVLGDALLGLEDYEGAVTLFRRGVERFPDDVGLMLRLADCFLRAGCLTDAEPHILRALMQAPDSVAAKKAFANLLAETGRIDEFLAYYNEKLSSLSPSPELMSSRLFHLNYSCRYPASYCFGQAIDYGNSVSALAQEKFAAWIVDRMPRRLKVGIVSGDLREHAVGFFVDKVFSCLGINDVELIAYPTHRLADACTLRLAKSFAAWKPLAGMSDRSAAEMIHADGVHVLVDLAGHTRNNRLSMFAWRAAPIQVSWLGYFATTGVKEIDYILVDEIGVPKEHYRQFVERPWVLPATRLCFSEPQADVSVSQLPSDRKGYTTFGCFQDVKKIQQPVLHLWAKILARLPKARLRVQSGFLNDSDGTAAFAARLREAGIDPGRADLFGSMSRKEYLAAYGEVDFVLDTFPFCGGTTTCEALWMGVPTLTLAGDSLVARQGASLLTAAGLPQWVATTEAEYIEKAVAFAENSAGLSDLRARLRQQVLLSPLFDAPLFAKRLAGALWEMWSCWKAENPEGEGL